MHSMASRCSCSDVRARLATPQGRAACRTGGKSACRQPAAPRAQPSQFDSNDSTNYDSPFSEEGMLQRLQAAEAEAARLREELEAAKGPGAVAAEAAALKKRIDGADLRRETMFFDRSNQRNWLRESDVEFFTEPSEEEGAEGEVVKRRLVFGLLAAAGLGAFALVPTEDLSLRKPSKPLFFYLAPLLRAQSLLTEAEAAVNAGNQEELLAIVRAIVGPPNNVQDNLRSAAASLGSNRQIEEAQAVGRDVYEAVLQINSQEYYDTRAADSKVQAQLAQFSLAAVQAAKTELGRFLALMPREQVEVAQQVNAQA